MSEYTPASWNTGLYLNELKNEIDEIGTYVGFFWNLIPVNGISISGNQTTGYNVSAPNGNNNMYAYSSIARNPTWEITYSIPDGSVNNVFVGISENLTSAFPSPSAPSTTYVKYGMLTDQQTGNLNLYKIENGAYSSTAFKWGTTYKITYDGTTLLYYVDDIQVISYTVELSPSYLIVGSFAGGVINNITFSGSGSGGGGAGENLQMVLSNGNDAGNLDITNVGNLTVNKYLTISNSVSNTSQLHLCWDSGNTTTGSNIQLVGLNDGTGFSELQIQNYQNNALNGTWLTMNKSENIFELEVKAPSFAISPNIPVLDIQNNPPNYFYNIDYTGGGETKVIPSGQTVSIMSFDLQNANYAYFCASLQKLSFTLNVDGDWEQTNIIARFALSNTQDDVNVNANFIGYSTTNLNPYYNSGNADFLLPNPVVLSALEASNGRYLYLNVYISTSIASNYVFSNLAVAMEGQASPATLNNVSGVILS